MAQSGQKTRYVHNQAEEGAPNLYSHVSNNSSNTDSFSFTRKIQRVPCSSSPASHSSTTIDSTLSHSTLDTSTGAPLRSSNTDQSAHQSQTSLSPLLARVRAGTAPLTSSSSPSKTKFLKAIFDRKRKDNKQASQGSLNTAGSSSQASSCGPQTPPPALGSSSQKKNEYTKQQQPPVSFADLAYRYGSPPVKPLHL
jgi:hypothetical protein